VKFGFIFGTSTIGQNFDATRILGELHVKLAVQRGISVLNMLCNFNFRLRSEMHGPINERNILIPQWLLKCVFFIIIIWFVRLLTLRPLLAYCANLG
jgi:hypothetical protein